MTPEHWQQVREVFYAALDREAGDRAVFLAQACAGQPSLRAEIDDLLARHEDSGGILDQPAWEPSAEDEGVSRVGQRIGPYEVREEIGHGGMGEVYLAVRADDEYRKTVAIKVVRRGMDTAFVLKRFRQERQVLAALDHPNIARLLDGGVTPDGLPYLVMDRLEGAPIDRYCRDARLSLPRRLELFLKVCAAVHFAHQSLVVHRDIKPGNILVTADGEPKLLDFGIAKILQPSESAAAVEPTVSVLRLMTPEYASPEQVRGGPITTATDVYSLGLLLYELLTGRQPQRTASRSPEDVERLVCLASPPPPSADGDRSLRGDLDTIVLKAIQKEPARRYGSVQELSLDVRRYLDGLPIEARRDTIAYRTRKFVRRHRGAVAAAVLLSASLVAGLVATAWQAHVARAERARAERRFAEVRELANAFLFDFHDAIARLPGSTPAREMVVQKGLVYLRRLAGEAAGDPDLLLELVRAYQRLGNVQGMTYAWSLGRTDDALASYEQALALLARLDGKSAARPDALRERASVLEGLGNLRAARGESPVAIARYREASEVLSRAAAASPEVDLRGDIYTNRLDLGDALWEVGQMSDAVAEYQAALRVVVEGAARAPADERFWHWEGVLSQRLGDALGLESRWEEALARQRRSLALDEALAQKHPDDGSKQHDLSTDHVRLGLVLSALGRHQEAVAEHQRARDLRERLFAEDPHNQSSANEAAESRVHHAIAWAQAGGGAPAIAQLDSGLGLYRELAAADSRNARLLDVYADGLLAAARLHRSAGRDARAEELLQEAVRVRREVAAFAADFAPNLRGLAEAECAWGELLAGRATPGRAGLAEARGLLERGLAGFAHLRAQGPLPTQSAETESRATATLKRLSPATPPGDSGPRSLPR